jgi:hypothetical protein
MYCLAIAGGFCCESIRGNRAAFTACFSRTKPSGIRVNLSDFNRLDMSSNCHQTFVKALSTAPKRAA